MPKTLSQQHGFYRCSTSSCHPCDTQPCVFNDAIFYTSTASTLSTVEIGSVHTASDPWMKHPRGPNNGGANASKAYALAIEAIHDAPSMRDP